MRAEAALLEARRRGATRRRLLAGLGALAGLGPLTSASLAAKGSAPAPRHGRIIAIGGAEDRMQDRLILRRFIELSGGPSADIVLLTAASNDPVATFAAYAPVFQALGVDRCSMVDARERGQADDPVLAARLLQADGIFMTGGDQRRLMASIGGSAFARSMREAFTVHGACIAGTSAGAAALSRWMLAEGSTPWLPEKDAARLDDGLGLVPNAIIDQHFSERRRLGRLMSVLAEQPERVGVGIDEDTALVIERGRGVEVVGRGVVTVLDGRRMLSNLAQVKSRERLELLGMRLHLLPAGNRYGVVDGERGQRPIPPSLREAISLLVAVPSIRE